MIAQLHQWCTVWPQGQSDGWGGTACGPPLHLRCRWQATTKIIRDKSGAERVAAAVVYLPQPIDLSARIARGRLHDPSPTEQAYEPQSISEAVGVDGRPDHWRVYV